MGEIGGKHGVGVLSAGSRLDRVCLVGVCVVFWWLRSIVVGVGEGGCAGSVQSSLLNVVVDVVIDSVWVFVGVCGLMVMVDGVGVGGCAGAAQSSVGMAGVGVQSSVEPKSTVKGVSVGRCAGSVQGSAVAVIVGVVMLWRFLRRRLSLACRSLCKCLIICRRVVFVLLTLLFSLLLLSLLSS